MRRPSARNRRAKDVEMESGMLCPNGTLQAIARAIPQMGEFDLIMAGREAGDWGEGRTAGLLAEHLEQRRLLAVYTVTNTSDARQLRSPRSDIPPR